MPGEVSGMVYQGGWWWGMARMFRGMRTVALVPVLELFPPFSDEYILWCSNAGKG